MESAPAKGTLYLIPCFIAETDYREVLPEKIREVVAPLQYFAVENIRSARRFIRRILPDKPIDPLTFYDIGKRSDRTVAREALTPCRQGFDLGVISEAGVPAVADPGALVVREAHRLDIPVVPLSGPSSLLMALMASGLSGQNFAFNGYLPIDPTARANRLRQLEKRSEAESSAQLFIETPFRNGQMLQAILGACSPTTLLTAACDLTSPQQYIHTRSIARWRTQPPEGLDRRPTVFILQKLRSHDD